ncbi:MAG: thiamine pyrophosphate-dependent enzyme, partial [Halobacteriales archaeon]|nr:thiamine pyrophosphate-dependent enzyme [Halobacteriales archaeon]
DTHEAMNFAGVFDTPTIFFCNNNQWAISVPREQQTASDTIAQKATAYGFDGVQVDGMDPLAVYAVTRDAAAKARETDGKAPRPTLVEAIQYRYGAHTTADDPTAYRSEEELERWRKKDPIDRFEAFLRRTGRLDEETETTITDRIEEELSTLIETAEEAVDPDPLRMFDFVYEEPTPRISEQRDYLEDLIARHGEDEIVED